MERILTDLESLVITTQYWYQAGEDSFRATGDDPDQIVTSEQLATLHPHLPVALKKLIQRMGRHNGNCTEGHLVCDTLELLQFGGIEIEGDLFINIDSLTIPERKNGLIKIGGILVTTGQIQHEGNNVLYVTFSEWHEVEANRSYLDENFPGWEERYRIMDNLGLENKDMWRHILSKDVAPIVPKDINNITFE